MNVRSLPLFSGDVSLDDTPALLEKLEQQEERIRELETRQSNQERMVRIIRHDLSNPLANLRMAETILRQKIPDDCAVILDTLALSIDAIQEVIEDFTNAYLLQDHITIHLESIWADEVLYNVILQYSPAAIKKQIVLALDDSANYLIADRARLSQVTSNLISNALKYSPPGSTVRVWSEAKGNWVRLSVADEGSGIPAEERHLLFSEYGKLSPRPTGNESSTGLGLWIVRTLTEAMNGIVGADFPESGGSIFWVELPAAG